MLRSMYSGISGLKNFQTKLDVIGNNIANVNTYGFKKGRVVFKDLFSQQIAGATGAGDTKGGVNPRQVGLGAQLASIDMVATPGSTQTTGRTLDLAIVGDGFFRVSNATKVTKEDDKVTSVDELGDFVYTRGGSFYFDTNGYIVNGDGLYLTTNTDPSLPIQVPKNAQSFSIGADGTVTYISGGGETKPDGGTATAGDLVTAGTIAVYTFSNSGGLSKIGNNLYQQSDNSGTPEPMGNKTEIVAGALEMSNVDLSEEFTEMIVAQRGFQANTKIITTSDEILQELNNLKR